LGWAAPPRRRCPFPPHRGRQECGSRRSTPVVSESRPIEEMKSRPGSVSARCLIALRPRDDSTRQCVGSSKAFWASTRAVADALAEASAVLATPDHALARCRAPARGRPIGASSGQRADDGDPAVPEPRGAPRCYVRARSSAHRRYPPAGHVRSGWSVAAGGGNGGVIRALHRLAAASTPAGRHRIGVVLPGHLSPGPQVAVAGVGRHRVEGALGRQRPSGGIALRLDRGDAGRARITVVT